ncbi:MAG TPA: PA14 domain-containing protein, partial [Verrucomicrobiae bacterium]
GDGMSVTVRAASDTATPSFTEMIPASMLEFPTNLNRLGPVNYNGAGSNPPLVPVNPTVTQGRQATLFMQGLCGAQPYYFLWLKNGVPVEAVPGINSANNLPVAPFYKTPPVTMADNGAVFTLVVSNLFSVITQSTTLTVTADVTPPTIVSAVGSQFDTTVLLTFSEGLDPFTAGQLANYQVSGGVTVLSATFDPVARNQVALRTTLQAAGQQYTVTLNGVRDFSGNAIAANSTVNFTAWGFGGLGTVYVEYWTNQLGSSYAALENDPRYINNQPSGSYYTNVFVAGQFATGTTLPVGNGESGRNFWGARVTGMFMPPSNGLYRFFVRADDGSKLYMNTNGSDPNGAVLIAQNLGANSSTYYNGQGANGANGQQGSASAPISLTNGVGYFMQAIFKEGTGGDGLEVVFRSVDAATLTDYPPLGQPTGAGDAIGGGFFQTTGNPDINQFLIGSQPPSELTVYQNDPVFLELIANTIPVSLASFVSYQWQKTNTATGTFTNLPGATTRSLSFFASLTDDGLTYRLLASIPGKTLVVPTLLHVIPDTNAPYVVSVSSLDGTTIGVHYDGPVDLGIALEPSTYYFQAPLDGIVVATATLKPGDPTRVLLTLDPLSIPYPLYGDFPLYVSYAKDLAGNESFDIFATGAVQRLTAKDIYLTSGNVVGGYNLALPGSTWTDTNAGFDISANGYDIWNTADGFHFAYREVTGNFDIKTRINKLIGADQWSKAGLMARGSTNANSRMMFMCAVPTTTPIVGQAANNFFAAQYRDIDGGAPGNVQNTVPPSYPNAAVRLQRSNAVFYGFWSTNGTDGPWTLLFSRDTALLGVFPDTLQVGLATTSHDQTRGLANNAYAEYRE